VGLISKLHWHCLSAYLRKGVLIQQSDHSSDLDHSDHAFSCKKTNRISSKLVHICVILLLLRRTPTQADTVSEVMTVWRYNNLIIIIIIYKR